MKTGTIIRGCNIEEDYKNEKEILDQKVEEKLKEITQSAQLSVQRLLGVFAEEMHSKITDIDKHKVNLTEEYVLELKKNEEKMIEIVNGMKDEHNKLLKRQEEEFRQYLNGTHDTVKELMLILFEKFFFTQYKDTENIDALIQEGLRQLEDSASIKITTNKELLDSFSEEYLDKLKNTSSSNIELSSHNKEKLLIKIESDIETIEADFNKQMEKIKEIVHSF